MKAMVVSENIVPTIVTTLLGGLPGEKPNDSAK